jgi:rhamnosyltransferase
VTYEPQTIGLLKSLEGLIPEVEGVIIVDNGSRDLEEARLREAYPSLTVIRLAENKGIGGAQNEGIALARKLGYAYVLLMDQDSVPQSGMVACLRAGVERLRAEGRKVACVGPRIRYPGGPVLPTFVTLGWLGRRYAACADTAAVVECDTLISSGSLIPLDAVADVGAMDEGFFIDQVDAEWCLRARSRGYRVYGACGAVLEHHLGESAERFWAGRWRTLPRHQPFRYYYIFRNTILLARRKYTSLRWVLFNAAWLASLFVLYGLLTPRRLGELRMMRWGVVDGMKGVSGKLRR